MTKTSRVQYVVRSTYISGIVSNHRSLDAAAKKAHSLRSQHARVYAVVDDGMVPVPVCWDTDGTWTLGEWDDSVPADLIAAVEAT